MRWLRPALLLAGLLAAVSVPADTPPARAEDAPAAHLTSETVDLGNGWGQTLWRDLQGRPYDLGLIVRLPGAAAAAGYAAAGGDVPALIAGAARRWGVDAQRMLRVAWCESKYQPGATSRGGHRGVFQFDGPTWRERAPLVGVSGDFAVAYQAGPNVEVAASTMAAGQWGRWACR